MVRAVYNVNLSQVANGFLGRGGGVARKGCKHCKHTHHKAGIGCCTRIKACTAKMKVQY
jgi:hypothetical protein